MVTILDGEIVVFIVPPLPFLVKSQNIFLLYTPFKKKKKKKRKKRVLESILYHE